MVMFFGRLGFYFPYLTYFLLTTLACFQTSDGGSICELTYFSLFPEILPHFDPTSRNPKSTETRKLAGTRLRAPKKT